MATFDMTTSATAGVSTSSIAAHNSSERIAYSMEATLDIAEFIAAGNTVGSADIFQLLEVPANSVILSAGCEILTVFTGTSVTVDVGLTGGDTITDGGPTNALAYPAKGTNGATLGTFSALIAADADTIDVKLIAGSSDCTAGKIRVYAVVVDIADKSASAASVARDVLA
tara:strand:+ start:909 stop:1418 length:510 start_codon:yes stop_codon:yes gene_type:complete